jgi:hypothetical protein
MVSILFWEQYRQDECEMDGLNYFDIIRENDLGRVARPEISNAPILWMRSGLVEFHIGTSLRNKLLDNLFQYGITQSFYSPVIYFQSVKKGRFIIRQAKFFAEFVALSHLLR